MTSAPGRRSSLELFTHRCSSGHGGEVSRRRVRRDVPSVSQLSRQPDQQTCQAAVERCRLAASLLMRKCTLHASVAGVEYTVSYSVLDRRFLRRREYGTDQETVRTEQLGQVRFGARVSVHPALDGGSLVMQLAKHRPAVLQSLLRTHGLLVFSQQDPLEPQQMAAVMSQLGSLSQCNASRSAKVVEGVADAPSMAVPGLPFVRRLGNIVDSETGMPQALHCRTGYEWHSDGERRLTMLSCSEAPRAGGQTLFASSSEVYTNLPVDERAQADCMIAVYGSTNTSGGPSAFDCERGLRMSADGTRMLRPVDSKPDGWQQWESRRPLVCSRDDDSSQRFITVDIRHFLRFEYFVSESSDSSDDDEGKEEARECDTGSARCPPSLRIASLSPEESQELLSRWLRMTLQPQDPQATLDPQTLLPGPGEVTAFAPTAVYTHQWNEGDVLIWDNDWVLHTATPASSVEGRRLMHQIIMKKPSIAGNERIPAVQDGGHARPVAPARAKHVPAR